VNKVLMHRSQETNRARLVRAAGHLNRALNASIKEGASELIDIDVRLAIILWMSWLESSVQWLASHPRVPVATSEAVFAKKAHDQKWVTLLTALKAGQPPARSDNCDVLIKWVQNDVLAYAEIRNKLAHGQWQVCLTSDHTIQDLLCGYLVHLLCTKQVSPVNRGHQRPWHSAHGRRVCRRLRKKLDGASVLHRRSL
jgi:hypothetical protein